MKLQNFLTKTARPLLITFSFLFPFFTHAQILFSEIAWMGTDAGGANDEWIELYNLSSTPTDVTGWTVTLNGLPFITLSGQMTPHGIAVLERTDDDVLPGIAFQIYKGALPNTGATLTLKDPSGTVTDEVVGGTNWVDIGGSNVTGQPKMTPQRTRTGAWVTGIPTPGADNVQESVSIPEDVTDTVDNGDNEVQTKTETSKPQSRGGGGLSRKPVPPKDVIPNVLTLGINAPKTVYVNQKVDFEAVPSGIGSTLLSSLVYTWNFGDTEVGASKKMSHVFAYPGEYIVVVNAKFVKQSALARQEITVLPTSFEIARTESGDVVLKNKSKYEVDMGGYTLIGKTNFMFPKFTFVKANGSITIPKEKIGDHTTTVTLRDTERAQVASLGTVVMIPQQPIMHVVYLERPKPAEIVSSATTGSSESIPETVIATNNIPKSSQNIIQIGNSDGPQQDTSGFFGRFFKKILSVFE